MELTDSHALDPALSPLAAGADVAYSDVPLIDPDGGSATGRIATIGVYGFTAGTFLEKLTGECVGLLLDLRQRRGVRGPDHSWANSARLQRALAVAHIDYRHVKELAPTTEPRRLQYREDDRQGVGKRSRITLASEYAERYTREILDPFDLGAIVAELPTDSTTVLLCVERDPEACHRSLVAARVRAEHGLPVTNLRPGWPSSCSASSSTISNTVSATCRATGGAPPPPFWSSSPARPEPLWPSSNVTELTALKAHHREPVSRRTGDLGCIGPRYPAGFSDTLESGFLCRCCLSVTRGGTSELIQGAVSRNVGVADPVPGRGMSGG